MKGQIQDFYRKIVGKPFQTMYDSQAAHKTV